MQMQLSADLSLYSTHWKNEHRIADGHLHYFLLHHCGFEDMRDMQGIELLRNFTHFQGAWRGEIVWRDHPDDNDERAQAKTCWSHNRIFILQVLLQYGSYDNLDERDFGSLFLYSFLSKKNQHVTKNRYKSLAKNKIQHIGFLEKAFPCW